MTITELFKNYRKEQTFIWVNKKINRYQKYRKITKSLFKFYIHKEERKKKERKTLSKYNRDLYIPSCDCF
jgi:hypothetical protein